MKTIYIKGTRPSKHPLPLISYLIRLITWSNISHTVIEFKEDNDLYHTYFNNILFDATKDFYYNNEVLENYEFNLPDELYGRLRAYCKNNTYRQKGYFAHSIMVAVSLFFRLFDIRISNKIARYYKSKTCSSLIAELMRNFLNIDHGIFINADIENITEKDIFIILDKYNS